MDRRPHPIQLSSSGRTVYAAKRAASSAWPPVPKSTSDCIDSGKPAKTDPAHELESPGHAHA